MDGRLIDGRLVPFTLIVLGVSILLASPFSRYFDSLDVSILLASPGVATQFMDTKKITSFTKYFLANSKD